MLGPNTCEGSKLMANRKWSAEDIRNARLKSAHRRRDSGEYREGYAEARRAFLIGQAVRERNSFRRISVPHPSPSVNFPAHGADSTFR